MSVKFKKTRLERQARSRVIRNYLAEKLIDQDLPPEHISWALLAVVDDITQKSQRYQSQRPTPKCVPAEI
jgi:hypothetical protein